MDPATERTEGMGSSSPPAAPPAPSADGGLATALAGSRAHVPRAGSRSSAARRTWTTVAVVVVAVVLLSALAVGVFHALTPGSGSGGGKTPGAPTSFYGSLAPALSTAKGSYWSWPTPSGPALVFAEGLASPVALGSIVNETRLGVAACMPTLISTSIGALPAYVGLLTAGVAPGWLYAFEATGNELVVVAVVNGSAAIVATTSMMGTCYSGPGSFSTVVVDSSVAAQTAAGTNLSSKFFAAANANATAVSAEFYLVPPGFVAHAPIGEPMWILTDSTCPLFGDPSATGTTLTSEISAGTGALYAQTTATGTC
jgi:hypothetical protein